MPDGNGDGLTLEWKPAGKQTATVTARLNGDALACETFNLTKGKAREAFAQEVAKDRPGIEPAAVEAELLRAAAEFAGKGDTPDEGERPERDYLASMPEHVRTSARATLEAEDLMQRIGRDFTSAGIAGERALAGTIYLTGVSRLLERPLALLIQGPSSSGKTYILGRVAMLFPAEAVLHSTTMSPTALFYAKRGTLSHRFVVAGERSRRQDDDQAEVTRALRELLSEGRLSRLVTVKQSSGPPVSELVEQEGPISYCETTTLPASQIFAEDLNRMLLLTTNETPRQTKAVLRRVAEVYQGGPAAAAAQSVIERHHAMQRMLRSYPVNIPFAASLADRLPATRLEIRRGYPHLLGMVSACATLHQFQRKQTSNGELVATLDDYRAARALLSDPLGRLLGKQTSDGAIRFLGRLVEWFGRDGEYTVPQAKAKEQHSPSSVYMWNSELAEAGLVEIAQEKRGNTPARWRVVRTPEEAADRLCLLPEAEELQT
jgi:hypothetical protein